MVLCGSLLKEIVQLFASLGDVVMGALNKFMLGSDAFFSAMLSQDDVNLKEDSGSWLVEGIGGTPDVKLDENYMDEKSFLIDASDYQIPNMLYSPESIFANNIAMLDVNFLHPNEYTSIIPGYDQADKMATSAVDQKDDDDSKSLGETIASWYKSFRNIAVVALLSVLVYLGIRILISSTAPDKARYKEALKNWLVALCLVFVIHFIMSGILMITENFNSLFSKDINQGILVEATPSDESSANANGKIRFKTNLIGLARFRAQADTWQDATAYTIIYLALVIYTCIFTFMYFKRFLYMAFFTMIAPLVALTYPIDKVGDGKAQAFNIWFKEYTMNAIIQPVHLILYTVFVSSATELATDNPIYAIVAIAFLIPAEKFIKKMFGLDKAESAGGFGSFAGGAVAMKGLQTLANLGSKKGKASLDSGKEGSERDEKVRVFNNTNPSAKELDAFKQRSNNFNDNQEKTRLADNNQYNIEKESKGNELEGNVNAENTINSEKEESFDKTNMIDNELGKEAKEGEQEESDLTKTRNPNDTQQENKKKRAKEIKGAVGKIGKAAGSNAWKAAKFTGRTLARTSGAVGGAAVGLAAGLTTGDMSKALSFAATGAMAGNAIGKNAANAPGRIYAGSQNMANKARTSLDSATDLKNELLYGKSKAKEMRDERQNARNLKQLYKDKDQIAKANDLAAEMNYEGDSKDIIRAKADFYQAGITDEKLIENAIKASYKESGSLSGQTHNEYVNMAAMIDQGGLTAKNIIDEKSMHQMEERVETNIEDVYVQKEVMTKMADLLGQKKLYEKRSREGKTKINIPINQQHNNKEN